MVINPEKVPVRVYSSEDEEALKLDGTTNSLLNILKSCLVTGYGNQPGLGWELAFEDMQKNVKVFKTQYDLNEAFYFRCAEDNGKTMRIAGYSEMSDVDSGQLRLAPHSVFQYGRKRQSDKWILVGTPKSFWFFCESRYASFATKHCGSFLYAGGVARGANGHRAVYLIHTGGGWADGDFDIFTIREGTGSVTDGAIYSPQTGTSAFWNPWWFIANGTDMLTERFLSPVVLTYNKVLHQIPGIYLPTTGAQHDNRHRMDVDSDQGNIPVIVHGMSGRRATNVYIQTDYWTY